MSRHFFAGANTPLGFLSYFGNIIPLEKTNKKVYIKGGSGTGKSTLMRKTAALFEGKGHYIEYFHCSNDAQSIDGINAAGAGIAVVDGTAPHTADPQLPAAVDEIFNAADFLDKEYIRENQSALREMSLEKRKLYNRSYGYLKAAGEIYRLNEGLYQNAVNKAALNELTYKITRIFEGMKPNGKSAYDRELFATAITPDGVKSLVNSALKAEKTFILNGIGAMGIAELIENIQREANLLGIDTVSFKSPLNPERTEHLHIPAHDVSFITSNRYHEFGENSGDDDNADAKAKAEDIDFEELLDASKLNKYSSEINYNGEIFDELLQKAIRTMAASKDVHVKIEAIYSEAMDFKKMNRAYDKVLGYLMDN